MNSGLPLPEALRSSLQDVPFYASLRLEKVSLADLPVMSKAMMQDEIDRFLSVRTPSRSSVLAALKEPASLAQRGCTEFTLNDIVFEETTGTTGVPFRCVKSVRERARLALTIWHQRRQVDSEVTPESMFRLNHTGDRPLPWNPKNLEIENLLSLYRAIGESECRWLHATPSTLLKHIYTLTKHGHGPDLPHLEFVESNGNFLCDDDRRVISEFLQARVLDSYGLVETWTVGLAHDEDGFRINSASVVTEVVDGDDRPVPTGEFGALLVTGLVPRLLPFVRYRTGDTGRIDPSSGNLELLRGRSSDRIVYAGAEFTGGEIVAVAANRVYSQTRRRLVRFFQVVQLSERTFSVRLSRDPGSEYFCQLLVSRMSELLPFRFSAKPYFLTDKELAGMSVRERDVVFRRMWTPVES